MSSSEVYATRGVAVRRQARCATCGRLIELLGKYGNGTDRWAHLAKGRRGRAHFARPREGSDVS